jgi:hypothetical protein
VNDTRCADASAAAGESLSGSAVTVENWLLIELRGTWPRDVSAALVEGEPGSGVLGTWLDRTPASRLLFIRRPRTVAGPFAAFVVRSSEAESGVRRIAFEDLDELELADLERGGEPVDVPLVLVCGHGTRDACCALRGSMVYGALAGQVSPDALWISSHQGGHRFAANVLVLPHGIQLGRVSTDDLGVVHDACAGTISLAHYRGRTTYAPHVQAAEAAVREVAGLRDLHDLALVADEGATVRFETRDGRTFAVAVDEVRGPAVPASCGVEPEPQKAFSARLV